MTQYTDTVNEYKKNKVIFCRLDWYIYYDGNEPINDLVNPRRKLQYERFNFKAYDGIYFGYANNHGSAGININKLNSNSKNAFSIFYSRNPSTNKNVIVGFYQNATCYSRLEKKSFLEDDVPFCLKSKVNDAFLIPVIERTIEMIPGAAKGITGSWGQTGIWYADSPDIEDETRKWISSTVDKLLLMKDNYESTKMEYDDAKFQILINEEPNENIPQKANISSREAYPRSPIISKNGITAANYLCEYDEKHITFINRKSKEQFVEAHHLIPMSKQEIILSKDMDNNGNIDIVENIVSLCPNCHKNIHLGIDNVKLIEKLYKKKIDGLKNKGFTITLLELKSFYNIN